MSRIKATFSAVKMSSWFVKTSWAYIVTKRLSSKVEFFVGIFPAWVRFTIATYKDCRKA